MGVERGRKFNREILEFEENVMWLRPDLLVRDKMESRWEPSGIFVGVRVESSELIILTHKGAIKVRAYRRKPEEERWDKEFMMSVKGLPWEPVPGSKSLEIRARYRPEDEGGKEQERHKMRPLGANGEEGIAEPEIKQIQKRGIYITKKDIKPEM